jgi:DNA-binding NtrC family response regulator
MKQRVLLIEDTATLQMVYSANLTSAGYAVDVASNGVEGFELFRNSSAQVVIMDLFLPDIDGIEAIKSIKQINPQAKIIVITSNGSVTRAVEAMRAGAFDFLVKPFSDERLLAAISSALASVENRSDVNLEAGSFHGFTGRGPVMQEMYRKIIRVASSSAPVILTGECGISKETCAHAIHARSNLNEHPFITYSGQDQSASEQENTLFGGFEAVSISEQTSKKNALAKAFGGSLYINEISELAPLVQLKLSNLLRKNTQNKHNQNLEDDGFPRIICSTSTDPFVLLEEGKISNDLFYQLHILTIYVPCLHELGDDIIYIAQNILAKLSKSEQKSFVGFSDEVSAFFMSYDWPGDINQMENLLYKIVAHHDGTIVDMDMLPREFDTSSVKFDGEVSGENKSRYSGERSNSAIQQLIGLPLNEVERKIIDATIHSEGGSIPKAAGILGVAPSTIYRKITNT